MSRNALNGLVVCLLLSLSVLEAAASDAAFFVAAQLDETRGVIRFETSTPFDWQAAASRQALGFDWKDPGPAEIARLRNEIWEISNAAERHFAVALPAIEKRAAHSFISAAGIDAVAPSALEGTARFRFDRASPPAIVDRTFFGFVLAEAPSTARGGGFVVRSQDGERPIPVPSTIEFAHTPEGDELHYADRHGTLALRLPDPWFAGSDTAFGFTFAGKRFLFVAWLPDRLGAVTPLCDANYSIYRIEQALTLIGGNSYGCDP